VGAATVGKQAGITDREAKAAKPSSYLWDAAVSGLALRVTPLGVKTFVFRYRVHGKQKYAKLGRYGDAPGQLSVKDAREAARKLAGVVAQGKDPMGSREAKTLQDLADVYTKEYAPQGGLKAKTVKDAEIVLGPMLKALGGKRLPEITPADVRWAASEARKRKPRPIAKLRPGQLTWRIKQAEAKALHDEVARLRDLAANGPPPRPALPPNIHQANRLLVTLSKMFALAVQEGWRTDNPCKGVAKYKINRRKRYLLEAEIGQLLKACDHLENQSAANAIRLLLYTGARLREVLHAGWSQFDLERALWVKPSAHTKTKIDHEVALSGPLLDLLTEMREADPNGLYLFPGEPNEKGEVKPRADLKRPWAELKAAAKFTNVRLHDLRRTTSSIMASAGVDRQTIGRVLGHTQASTTDSYVSIFHDAQSKAIGDAGKHMAALRVAARRADIGAVDPANAAT
jgi:integrase